LPGGSISNSQPSAIRNVVRHHPWLPTVFLTKTGYFQNKAKAIYRMGKRRNWMAYLSVSASGPEYSPKYEKEGRTFRPRVTADIEYTTADIDYLEPYFQEPNYDSAAIELHKKLKNPTVEQFYDALQEIKFWLKSYKDDQDWDGGGIEIIYAGHGRINDGALVLQNGVVEQMKFPVLVVCVFLQFLTHVIQVLLPQRLLLNVSKAI